MLPALKKMTYKKGVFILLFLIGLFLVGSLTIWKLWTELLFSNQYPGGDLARLGYAAKQKRITIDNLPRRHLEMKDYRGQKIDLLTVGDSFSQGGGGGLNRYYQDAIASSTGMTVLNIAPYQDKLKKTSDPDQLDPVNTLLLLINSGYIDRIKPGYILLESVERMCGERLNKTLDLQQSVALEKLEAYYKHDSSAVDRLPQTFFLNNANRKFVYYNLRYYMTGKGHPTVPRAALTKPLFTGDNPSTLLYLHDDLVMLANHRQKDVEAINMSLNLIADMLQRKGIRFYFMPVVDKSNLYRPYLVSKELPESSFFEKIRPLIKRYQFVDSKALLAGELSCGELDIFHYDDTHWTWKASQVIARQTVFSTR